MTEIRLRATGNLQQSQNLNQLIDTSKEKKLEEHVLAWLAQWLATVLQWPR